MLFAAYPHVYGGTERGLQLLALGLQERGWDVEILAPAPGPVTDRVSAAGLRVEVVQAPRTLLVYGGATRGRRALLAAAVLPGYWAGLRHRLRGADVVHAFTQRAMTLAGPAARAAGARVVWHVGGTEPSRALNHAAARLANAVIAVSSSAVAGLPAAAHPVVVANGADPAAFEPVPAAAAAFHVACATRLTREKGVDVLVRAAAIVKSDVPDFRVLVLGDTQAGHEAYRDELVDLTGRLGVTDVVCFAGFVDQPFRHWAGARVYVQPSRREAFGLAAAEAMASGLPVIASSVGGLVDVLDEGRAGVLVPPDDPQALAEAIKGLLDDPERAAELARAGRQRAATHYTVDRMVDGVEAVYRRLLNRA